MRREQQQQMRKKRVFIIIMFAVECEYKQMRRCKENIHELLIFHIPFFMAYSSPQKNMKTIFFLLLFGELKNFTGDGNCCGKCGFLGITAYGCEKL